MYGIQGRKRAIKILNRYLIVARVLVPGNTEQPPVLQGMKGLMKYLYVPNMHCYDLYLVR